MILQRVFDAVLSALLWLVELAFPPAFVLTVLSVLGLSALLLLVIRRYRRGG
jgi:hypothetical protein